jgi:hypothetical protein
VILHENRSLSGPLRKKLNARKRGYIEYLVDLIGRVQEQSGRPAQISPRLAAFALLGMINWLYQWYSSAGPVKQDELGQFYTDFFFRGLLGTI